MNKKMDRREFLRTTGRYTLIGAISILTASLIRRRMKTNRCSAPPNQCRQCRELKQCALPQALAARRKQNG